MNRNDLNLESPGLLRDLIDILPDDTNLKKTNTSKTSINSDTCVQAYPSVDPVRRVQALEKLEKCQSSDDKTCMLTKDVLLEILNEKDPFRLFTHYSGSKIDLDRLRQARDCIYNTYYLPMTGSSAVKNVDLWIKNYEMNALVGNIRNLQVSSRPTKELYMRHFKRVNKNNQEYIKFDHIKETFDEFIKHVSRTWETDSEKLKETCNVMLNPVDVFSKCPANAACVGKSGQYKVSQPPILMKQLTTMHDALAVAHSNLTQALLQTKTDLRQQYARTTNNDAQKKLEKLLDKLLNDKNPLMQVPVTRAIGSYDDSRKEKERLKKQRQRNQKDLIRRVMTEKGTIRNKYDKYFNLQKPFNLARKGAQIKNSEGVVYTKYNRNERRGELQLRFKVKELNKLRDEPKLTQVISEMGAIKNLNKPLKLRKDERQGITVAKGGNRKQRDLLSLFAIRETKVNGKQKYQFTDETIIKLTKAFSKDISGNSPDEQKKIIELMMMRTQNSKQSIANSIANTNANTNANANRLNEIMTFDMKGVEVVVRKLFLSCLSHKLNNLNSNTNFSIGEFALYEMIDIPFIKQYRLTNVTKSYMFQRSPAGRNMNYPNFKLNKVENKINWVSSADSMKLEYMMMSTTSYIDYSSAVTQARQKVRANPELMLNSKARRSNVWVVDGVNNIARFYMRNEDRHRMDGIRQILSLLNLKHPENKKKKDSTKPKKVEKKKLSKTSRYVKGGILQKTRQPNSNVTSNTTSNTNAPSNTNVPRRNVRNNQAGNGRK